MKIIKRKTIYKGKHLQVVKKEYLTKSRKKGFWECVERIGGVLVFALTKNKEVILEKIFRIPIESYSIELPSGALDKRNEEPKETAKRELREETGYLAKKLTKVFKWKMSPWFSCNEGILFFAPKVEFIGKKGGEDVEEIEIIKVPLKDLEKFLTKQSKRMNVEISIFAAIALLKKKKLI
jgi:ADP-ribose pyrophosphatase